MDNALGMEGQHDPTMVDQKSAVRREGFDHGLAIRTRSSHNSQAPVVVVVLAGLVVLAGDIVSADGYGEPRGR